MEESSNRTKMKLVPYILNYWGWISEVLLNVLYCLPLPHAVNVPLKQQRKFLVMK